MLEVNVQWEHMGEALLTEQRSVHFQDEAARIAQHLHLVADHLRTHAPQGLAPSALASRNALLGQLDAYADRGLFPRNEVLPYRNPIFIDPYGTACAVGQLMIASGHRDLAERIDHEQEQGYIAELLRSPALGSAITSWAATYGFSADELAWIQPGYPPTTAWEALGGGVNGPVLAVLKGGGDTLVVVGQFTEAGGVPAQNVALWNGTSFSALGSGVSGTISSAAIIGQTIYIGGSALSTNYTDLATWDGMQWTYSTVFDGNFPQVRTLFVHDNTLYAGGIVMGFAGSDDVVKRLDNGNWTNVGSTLNNLVNCLGWHNGQLVVGGAFTALQNGGGTNLSHVAVLNGGDWGPLGTGLPDEVTALENMDGTLYAAGYIKQGGMARFGLARFAENGSAWEELMPNAGDYVNAGSPADARINAMHLDGTHLYIGGDFQLYMGTILGAHLARFDGGPDEITPLAIFDAPVLALASNTALGLIAGGDLTQNGDDELNHLAYTTLTTGIGQQAPAIMEATLLPNPVSDRLFVMPRTEGPVAGLVDVFNQHGQRLVGPFSLQQARNGLDVAGLAPGSYVVRIGAGGKHYTLPFIKR